MQKMQNIFKSIKITQIIGFVGTIIFLYYFATHLSWPTVDKLFILTVFVFLMFGQTKDVFIRFLPFVILTLTYESFRGLIADVGWFRLFERVNYNWMPDMDILLFGELPTRTLQDWFWTGSVTWLEQGLYLIYMMHFFMPWALAILIWKKRETYYWKYISSLLILSYAGFLTYLIFPAAPPWLASEELVIDPIKRLSSDVWWSLGLKDFPTVYSKISPNPIAAIPSLHAAYSTLIAIYTTKLFKNHWAKLIWLYPFGIYFGSVYLGEHYLIDMIIGSIYAIATLLLVHKTKLPTLANKLLGKIKSTINYK